MAAGVARAKAPRWLVPRLSLRGAILGIALVAAALAGHREWSKYRTIRQATYLIEDLGPDSDEPLIVEIMTTVQPSSWTANGGRGRIAALDLTDPTDPAVVAFRRGNVNVCTSGVRRHLHLLVINNVAAHEQIAELLRRKRAEAQARSHPGSLR